jgi:hypothetical protein
MKKIFFLIIIVSFLFVAPSFAKEVSVMKSPANVSLFSIWGTSNENIYAVGRNVILQYNGNDWEKMEIPLDFVDLWGIWGISNNNIYSVGYSGTTGYILRYNGSKWNVDKSVSMMMFNSVWGTRDSIFVTGRDINKREGVVYLYSKLTQKTPSWQEVHRSEYSYSEISGYAWGTSIPARAIIIGRIGGTAKGQIISYTDGFVNPVEVLTNTTGFWPLDIFIAEPCDIFVLSEYGRMRRYDCDNWTMEEISGYPPLYNIWGNSSNDIYATGDKGKFFHFDGQKWNEINSGTNEWLYDLWGYSDDVFIISSDGKILRYGEPKPKETITPEPTLIAPVSGELSPSKTPNAGLTPDSFFYFLDTFSEKIGMFLSFSKKKKAEKALKYSEEKIEEIKLLIERKKQEALEKARERLEQLLELAKEEKDKAEKEGEDIKELSNKIEETEKKHQETILLITPTEMKVPEEEKPTPTPPSLPIPTQEPMIRQTPSPTEPIRIPAETTPIRISCDDNNACTTDSYNSQTDSCENILKDCDDNDLCTIDNCDPISGSCLYATMICGDDNLCTFDSCDRGKCIYMNKDCADDNPQTTDSCDTLTGLCQHNIIDADGDGITDTLDNCPNTWNPEQADNDGDMEGNACDSTPDGPDSDDDGIADLLDNCPNNWNSDQLDNDNDGIGNICDSTPDGPDADGDGIADTSDNCSNTQNSNQSDNDGDGLGNACDNCPNNFNPEQFDNDGDMEGNACDSTPDGPDADGDGVPDVIDLCDTLAGPIENNGCPVDDMDGDGIIDSMDPCPTEYGPIINDGCPYGDYDGDGLTDDIDQCLTQPGPVSNNGCPL